MEGSKIIVNFKTIFYILICLPLLSIYAISMFGRSIIQVWQILDIIIMLGVVINRIYSRKVYLRKIHLSLIIYELIIMFSTFFNQGLSFGVIYNLIIIIELTLLMETDFINIVSALKYIMVFFALLNLTFMLLAPTFFGDVYLIGGKNALTLFIWGMLFFYFVSKNNPGFQKKDLLVIILSYVTILLGKSGTGIVSFFVLTILLVIRNKLKSKTMLILLISSVYITLIFFSIVLINTNIWEQFISFLGKTTDLTGRTDIWKMSLELFQNHIFFGNGKGLKFYLDTIWSNNYYVEECHNVLVEVITTSGVFGTVFFLDYVYESIRKINLCFERHRLVFIFFIGLLVIGLVESVNNMIIFYLIISSIYYISIDRKMIK